MGDITHYVDDPYVSAAYDSGSNTTTVFVNVLSGPHKDVPQKFTVDSTANPLTIDDQPKKPKDIPDLLTPNVSRVNADVKDGKCKSFKARSKG